MTKAGAREGLGLGKCGEQGEEGSRTQPAEDLWLMQQGGCVKEFHVGISWAHWAHEQSLLQICKCDPCVNDRRG